MDEMVVFGSDKGLIMSPENNNMTMTPLEYNTYDHHQYQIPADVFGSEEYGGAFVNDESASVNLNHHHHHKQIGGDEEDSSSSSSSNSLMMIKSRIISHPCYPKLLHAYIDCQKFGAPAEIVSLLEEMRAEIKYDHSAPSLGLDPQLDQFMEKYCEILVKYKCDLSKPFDEATSFLNNIQTQLHNLCNGDVALSSDEEISRGEIEIEDGRMKNEDGKLKEKLLLMYGSHISSLKQEFSKKKKKGKLPKEARQTLLHWWNLHCKWPYPTEGDKIALAESTGLDQKQINNWFINQRKRHWKSPENMQLAMMENLSAHFFLEE